MSIDFYLKKMAMMTVFDTNITHNVSPMWRLAGIYEDIYNSEGKKAGDVVENLKRGYRLMRSEPDRFEKLNPANGWGSYEAALDFLKGIIDACEENPDAIIGISK